MTKLKEKQNEKSATVQDFTVADYSLIERKSRHWLTINSVFFVKTVEVSHCTGFYWGEPNRYRHEIIDLTGEDCVPPDPALLFLGGGLPPSPQTTPLANNEGLRPSNSQSNTENTEIPNPFRNTPPPQPLCDVLAFPQGLFFSEKMTSLNIFDMYLVNFDINNQYLVNIL